MVAVAPLAAVVIALLALLILLGGGYLAKFVARLMPTNIPLIGSTIRAIVEGAANAALSALHRLLDDAVKPVVAVIRAPFTVVGRLYDSAVATMGHVYDLAKGIVVNTVPRVYRDTETFARGVGDDAKRWAHDYVLGWVATLEHTIDLARRYAADLVHAAEAEAAAALSTAVRDLSHAIDLARRYAADLVRVAEATAAAALSTAVRDLTGLISGLRAFVVDQVRILTDLINGRFADAVATAGRLAHDAELGAIAATDAAVTAGLTAVWPSLVTDVDGLITDWADTFPDVLGGITDAVKAIPRDIAGEAALAGVTTAVLARYLKQCGLPNCKNLGAFGHDLQALLNLTNDAAFIALIVGLALDPAATAREVDAVVGPVARGAAHGVSDLIGVR